MSRSVRSFRTRLRRTAVALAAGLLTAALAVGQQTGTDAAAQLRQGPNVLIIVTDDQRDDMSMMLKTREIFGGQGRTYRQAFVTTPLCCPSRGSIMTGRYAHNHGTVDNMPLDTFPFDETLQAELQRHGYTTAMYGKYMNRWPIEQSPPNFDAFATTSSPPWRYTDRLWNVNGTVGTVPDHIEDVVEDHALRFVQQQASSDKPWLMYVGVQSPHKPFGYHPAYRRHPVPKMAPNPSMRETDKSDKPPPVRAAKNTYEGFGARHRAGQQRMLQAVDDVVGNIFAELRRTGQDDTLAVFLSDNGYLWADHGLGAKRWPYTASVKVPFFIRWPGRVAAGSVDSRLAANVDIVPTVLAAVGADVGDRDGRNLLDPSWRRDRLLLEYGPINNRWWASSRGNSFQYTEWYDSDGAVTFREYYDLAADPWQLVNLYGDTNPHNDPPAAPLEERLAQDRACAGPTCP